MVLIIQTLFKLYTLPAMGIQLYKELMKIRSRMGHI